MACLTWHFCSRLQNRESGLAQRGANKKGGEQTVMVQHLVGLVRVSLGS